jgi:RNA recognition motif-containing protein
VGNLPWDTRTDELREAFGSYGQIKNVRLGVVYQKNFAGSFGADYFLLPRFA